MATSTSAPLLFNGSSTYAAQLQQTITHAVAVASLPLTALQRSQTQLTNQQSELQTVTSSFAAMQTAVNSLGSATGIGAFAATVSTPAIASAAISSGIMAGSYSLNVSSIGSQTNAISQNGQAIVTDPSTTNIDASTTYTLSLNGHSYSISDSSGTLNGLAQAINSSSASVQASVVNVGGPSSPDYRLSVQSLNYAPDSISLNNGTTDLLNTLSTGTNVTYQVNGQPSTPISSNSRSVTVSPGLSVQLLQAGTTQVTVAQSASNLASALSSFASAYNSINAELTKNRGQNGGALSGNSIIYQLQNQIQSLAQYSTATGSIHSLSDLGLAFDPSGTLTFDPSVFTKTASSAPNDLLNFIGTASTNGFLSAATNALNSITDPSNGPLSTAAGDLSNQLSAIATHITDDQASIATLQQKLTQQMANVDSTISSLQSQLSEITSLFTQMQTNQRALSGF